LACTGVRVVQRRTVAAAFDEVDARYHRIARKRLKRENQRLLHQAVDYQPVFIRVDVGKPGARHDEMQTVRCDRAIEQMVRRARLAGARLVVGIGERAHDVLFVLGRPIIGRDSGRRRCAAVGHVHDINLGLDLEQLYRQMTRHT
jgi:hypothetical protein